MFVFYTSTIALKKNYQNNVFSTEKRLFYEKKIFNLQH